MRQLAEGLYQLDGRPRNVINVYLAGDVLIDAGTRQAEGRILRQLQGHTVTAHALTSPTPTTRARATPCASASASRCGAARRTCPRWRPRGRSKTPNSPRWLNWTQERFWTGPPHPVAKALHEGDEVAASPCWRRPGTPSGHISLWREADRVLIAGDVVGNMNFITGIPGLHLPPDLATPNPARNRESARRLAALEPALACFGHGAPLRNPSEALRVRGTVPQWSTARADDATTDSIRPAMAESTTRR